MILLIIALLAACLGVCECVKSIFGGDSDYDHAEYY